MRHILNSRARVHLPKRFRDYVDDFDVMQGTQGNFTVVILCQQDTPVYFGITKRDPNTDADDEDRALSIATSRAVQSLLKTQRKTLKGGKRGRKGTN